MIEYAVHPPVLTPKLLAHLRGLGYDAWTIGTRLYVTDPRASDPTEERLALGGAIAAWRAEHPDARIDLTDNELTPDAFGF